MEAEEYHVNGAFSDADVSEWRMIIKTCFERYNPTQLALYELLVLTLKKVYISPTRHICVVYIILTKESEVFHK
jgi:hypothetical protein